MAAYEFTTLTTVPGCIKYKGAKVQLLDLPGIIEGAKDGKGRGRQVIKFMQFLSEIHWHSCIICDISGHRRRSNLQFDIHCFRRVETIATQTNH